MDARLSDDYEVRSTTRWTDSGKRLRSGPRASSHRLKWLAQPPAGGRRAAAHSAELEWVRPGHGPMTSDTTPVGATLARSRDDRDSRW